MKAFVYEKYGLPEVLELRDVPKPTPQENEVLVKIHAASLNPAEWHGLTATNIVVRAVQGVRKPKNKILGADIAGEVTTVGKNVTRFQVGDLVYGRSKYGGFAEYVSLPEGRLAPKPINLNAEEAAAVPLVAITGLQGMRKGQIQSGQHVLINGASGGIGTFSIQLAKTFDVEVTGVCSTRNIEMVRTLGADQVIDYTREKLVSNGRCYDIILDNVGNLELSDYRQLLKPTGKAVVIGFEEMRHMLGIMSKGGWLSRTSGQKISIIDANVNQKDLLFVKSLIEADKIKPVIDRCYPFSEIPDALSYLSQKHARGKVVIAYKNIN